MDYGKLLGRAWNIVWEHKFLILLGVLVALGSAGGGGNANANIAAPEGDVRGFDFQLPQLGEEWSLPTGVVAGTAVVLIGIALVVGIALWVVSTIARGGLIAGASAIDSGASSSFAQAWSAGWQKGWSLLGIGVLPALPGLILLVAGLGLTGVFAGLYSLLGDSAALPPRGGLGAILAGMVCIAAPIALVLSLLRTFANRACMLEDLGVFAAYRRGWDVLLDNIGPALVLFLLQIAISIGLGIVLLLPNVVMALCCVLWPVLLLVEGTIAAYFSTLWTLAWREWTGS